MCQVCYDVSAFIAAGGIATTGVVACAIGRKIIKRHNGLLRLAKRTDKAKQAIKK